MKIQKIQKILRRQNRFVVIVAAASLTGGLVYGGVVLTKRLVRKNINVHESRTIAALKNLSSAQAQFQASGKRDHNGNGAGEYGDFHEMTSVEPPVLAAAFAQEGATRIELHGYVFELHLPADPGRREKEWRVYAWPRSYGFSGKRAFMVSQSGDMLSSKNTQTRYSGDTVTPVAGSAFAPAAADEPVTPAANTSGLDGQVWIVV